MAGQKAMLEALAAVEKTRDQLFALFLNKPDGWQKQYIELRREHPGQMGRLSQVADEWLAAHGDTEDGRRFRELIANMRGTLAEHQANWPVVNIVPDDPDYRASMARIDTVRAELTSFVKTRLTG